MKQKRKRRDENAAYWVALRQTERQLIEWAVGQTGTIPRAAKLLGVRFSFLYHRCKALGLGHLYKPNRRTTEKDAA